MNRNQAGTWPSQAVDSRTRSDAELIDHVRHGSIDDYALLYERHKVAAERLARQLAGPADADDLVSEAFSNVLLQLRDGKGPDLSFRAYLLTTLRHVHIRRKKQEQRLQVTDDDWRLDQPVTDPDLVLRAFEDESVRRAFESLPERWQLVLWHLEVEKERPAQVAPLLGMSANSVSALAYRAREGLRQAYLRQHALDRGSGAVCLGVVDQLPSYVRSRLSKRETAAVERHLDDCRECYAAYLELSEMNSRLAGVLAPALLGGVGLGYASARTDGLTLPDHPWQYLRHRYFSSAAHAGPVAAKIGVGLVIVAVGGRRSSRHRTSRMTLRRRLDRPRRRTPRFRHRGRTMRNSSGLLSRRMKPRTRLLSMTAKPLSAWHYAKPCSVHRRWARWIGRWRSGSRLSPSRKPIRCRISILERCPDLATIRNPSRNRSRNQSPSRSRNQSPSRSRNQSPSRSPSRSRSLWNSPVSLWARTR